MFPTQIEELILKHPELSPQYQLVVTREGHLDSLEVMVETELVGGSSTGERQQRVVGQLQYEIKTFVGVSPRVSLVEPQTLLRSSGKAKRVVDHRNL